MELHNKAAVIYGKKDLRFEVGPVPVPGPNGFVEVCIQLKNCGICGTDMSWLNNGIDERYVTLPVVLGHECSGVVHTVAPGVTSLKPGDRVAVELGIPCRKCALCKSGKYNLCKPWSYGGLQNYLVHPVDFCHKLPDSVGFEEAALMEPLAVGVRAVRRAGVSLGSTVLVCAAGAVGLSSMMAARAVGASRVCVTDISRSRLDLACKMGATDTVLVSVSDSGRDISKKVVDQMGGQVDYSIECSGAEPSLQAAIYATQSGGAVSPVALHPPVVSIPLVDAAVREVDIKGVFSYCVHDYPAALAMVGSGKADPKLMITHRFPVSQLTEALELVKSRGDGVVKCMIQC